MAKPDFQPVLLGSDINVYGMARSFYEEYGIVSLAIGATHLAPTKHSKIVKVQVQPHFEKDEVFIKTLRQFMEQHQNNRKKFLLIACGDGYGLLLAKYKNELSKFFECPSNDFKLYKQLEDKPSFYRICEQYRLPYPKTIIVKPHDNLSKVVEQIPFPYPMILKPGNSISYLKVSFSEKKKAFKVQSASEMRDLLQRIYDANYPDEMIIQDFIPGTDSDMRVLNAYVDQNHKVRMMCLGHPLLEDPSPSAIGNYVAIMPESNPHIYRQLKSFLESIRYTGFANFDLKYDSRDGKYKLFEINLRQGRSSYYVTLNGYNLAKYVTEDRIYQLPFKATVYGDGDMLWLGIPKKLLLEQLPPKLKTQIIRKYIKTQKFGTTVFYTKDLSMRRYFLQLYAFYRYFNTYKEAVEEKI